MWAVISSSKGYVGQPQPALKQHRIVADQREHKSWNVLAGHHVPKRILELRQRTHGGNARLGRGRCRQPNG